MKLQGKLRIVTAATALVVGLVAMTGSASAATPCTNAQITNVSYTLTGAAGFRPGVTDMTGQVRQGDAVRVQFTVPASCADVEVSLASYRAPGPTSANLTQQQIHAYSTGHVGPGTYTETVLVPDCYFQIDFVRGAPLMQFTSTTTYTRQGRLLDAANGGTDACGAQDVGPGQMPGPEPDAGA